MKRAIFSSSRERKGLPSNRERRKSQEKKKVQIIPGKRKERLFIGKEKCKSNFQGRRDSISSLFHSKKKEETHRKEFSSF